MCASLVDANCSETHYGETAPFENFQQQSDVDLVFFSVTIYKKLLHMEKETEALQDSCGD